MDGGGRGDRRRDKRLEVLEGDLGIAVSGRDNLALLGQLQAQLDGSRRLAEERPLQLSTTPPDGATATVEQRELHIPSPRDIDEGRLGPMEQPVRGRNPDSLFESE